MAFVLKENYVPNTAVDFDGAKGTNKYQTFTATSSHDVDKIEIRLKKIFGAPSRIFGVYLYSFALGEPTTELANFGTFNQTSLTTSYAIYGFDGDSYSISIGVEYAIVVLTDEEVTNSWVTWYTNTGSGYADGVSGYHNYILGWQTGEAENNRWFKVYEQTGGGSPPTKAENPLPTDANASVTLDQATITWDDGGGADTFNVYYGTTSGSLPLVSFAQAGESFTVTGITDGSPYTYLSVRYWRIDSTNSDGTTTGDEWSFTTLRFDPPTKTQFYVTTGQYYQLLVQDDGSYGDPPGVGVENTDFVYLAAGYEANFISTNRKLVAAAENRIWYEDL